MVYLLGSVVFYLPTTKVAHNLADLYYTANLRVGAMHVSPLVVLS